MRNEEINQDEQPISQMLRTLPRVEAPTDFDFGVMARIAKGKPAARPAGWLTPIRLAAPVGLALMVGGYFAYSSYAPANDAPIFAVANSQPLSNTPAVERQSRPAELPQTVEVAADRRETKSPLTANRSEPLAPGSVTFSANGSTEGSRGGSLDSGLKPARKIYQKGLDPTVRSSVRPKDFDNSVQIPTKDILSAFGVDVIYSESGWKVASVKQNSTAERAGLKTGDVVEAINDQKLDEKTSFRGKFSGRNMRVKRGIEKVDIDLRKP